MHLKIIYVENRHGQMLVLEKKRGKMRRIDDGIRPSIAITKKGLNRPFFVIANGCQNGCSFSRHMSVTSKSSNESIPRSSRISSMIGNWYCSKIGFRKSSSNLTTAKACSGVQLLSIKKPSPIVKQDNGMDTFCLSAQSVSKRKPD